MSSIERVTAPTAWFADPRRTPAGYSRSEPRETPRPDTRLNSADRVIDLREGLNDRLRLASWRQDGQPRRGFASPTPERLQAAKSLGVDPLASQAEIDARFREIVKAERPDLGRMDADQFGELLSARRVLTQGGSRAVVTTFATRTSTPGRLIDLTA
jgi:hypothetical protein